LSTLTKICIVVMVVLAIPTSAVMIQGVLTRANYKQAYEDQVQRAKDARQSTAAAQAMLSKLSEDYKALKALKQADSDAHQLRLNQLQAELNQARLANAQLSSDKDRLDAQTRIMAESGRQQAADIRTLTNQLADSRTELQSIKAELQKSDLAVRDLSLRVGHANETARKLREQLVTRNEELNQFRERLRSGQVAVEGESRSIIGPVIRGTVTSVVMEHNVAGLNVGAASGVREGMKFLLYRGADLVGVLTVSHVDTNSCAGTLSDLSPNTTPRVADKATTEHVN